jgi:hypothetical protein
MSDGGYHQVLEEFDLEAVFEDVPRIENPTEVHRFGAERKYPPAVVPDGGPIPDPHHDYRPNVTVAVPDWVVAALAWQLSEREDATEDDLRDLVFECVQISPTYVTEQSDDLVDLLLNGGDC